MNHETFGRRSGPIRVLHAIHDFLPRHQAGSEIYALNLCLAQQALGLQTHVLCTDDDVNLEQGSLRWRLYRGVGVTELINNWMFPSFREMYSSPLLNRQLRHVLMALAPDVLHIHNLLNLSFDLPAIAKDLGIPTVATLHDYTLVCPSGGQRLHDAEAHICALIDPRRCSRCFAQHNFYARSVFGPASIQHRKRFGHALDAVRQRAPFIFGLLVRATRQISTGAPAISAAQIEERLEYVTRVFASTDLFIAPSPQLATEYRRLGLPAEKLRVSDYGFVRFSPARREPSPGRLRIGFVGTLVWHKGVHVLLEAVRSLPSNRFEVLVFGDPDTFPDYSAALREQARGLPVRFRGRFERNQVPEVYASFDVLVIPSLWPENSPLVIHEAFMAGIPVVGSRLGGTQDLVADGVNGLLYDAFSPAALARALRSLIDEPQLLEKLAAETPEVKSMRQDASECAGIYRELLSNGASAATVSAVMAADRPGRTTGVLLNHSTPDDTLLALQSIQASRRPFRTVILVDNGSHDDWEALLRDRTASARLIVSERHLGFPGGCNLGIRAALAEGAEHVLLLSGDTILPPDTLQQLENALDANPRLGIVGPVIVSRRDPTTVVSSGMRFSPTIGRIRHIGRGEPRSDTRATRTTVVDAVSRFAMLVRRDVFDKIGLLCEEYFLGFEDLDLCLRARAAGFETACVESATALHEERSGLRPSTWIYFATRNHLLLASRIAAQQSQPHAWITPGTVMLLNLAQALFASNVAAGEALRAFVEGVRDHLRGRYGPARQADTTGHGESVAQRPAL